MTFNFKPIFAILLGSGLFLFSCKNIQNSANQTLNEQISTDQLTENNKKMLIGSWED